MCPFRIILIPGNLSFLIMGGGGEGEGVSLPTLLPQTPSSQEQGEALIQTPSLYGAGNGFLRWRRQKILFVIKNFLRRRRQKEENKVIETK